MPIYTYLCSKCKKKFDLLVGINQEKRKLECPSCGGKDLDKLLSTFRVMGGSSKETSTSSSSSRCSSCSGGDCSSCH